MAGEFRGGGHLRDAYGREVYTVATLNDPLDPDDVQAGGDVLTLDGKKQIVLVDATGETIAGGSTAALVTALDNRRTFGAPGAAYTSSNLTLNFQDPATGIICRSLYAIVYLGAHTTLSVTSMAAGEASSAFLEIQHVGGPWTITIKGGVKTQAGTGTGLSLVANKLDMLTIWTPDGTALRAKTELDYR